MIVDAQAPLVKHMLTHVDVDNGIFLQLGLKWLISVRWADID